MEWNNNKEKESSPNNEEIKKDNVEKETTNSLPIVGQHPEVWMILLGTGLLFIVLILIKYKSKNKKSSNKE